MNSETRNDDAAPQSRSERPTVRYDPMEHPAQSAGATARPRTPLGFDRAQIRTRPRGLRRLDTEERTSLSARPTTAVREAPTASAPVTHSAGGPGKVARPRTPAGVRKRRPKRMVGALSAVSVQLAALKYHLQHGAWEANVKARASFQLEFVLCDIDALLAFPEALAGCPMSEPRVQRFLEHAKALTEREPLGAAQLDQAEAAVSALKAFMTEG